MCCASSDDRHPHVQPETEKAKSARGLNSNPLAGAQTFTVEAVFRPDAGGNHEQRWFHIQEETGDDRVLLETRLDDDQWFTDTFIKSGENSRTLYAENFKHPIGEWYHVALVYDGSMMRH